MSDLTDDAGRGWPSRYDQPSPAMARALAMIDRVKANAMHDITKRHCRAALRDPAGMADPELAARYGARLRALNARGLDLDQSIATIARLRTECRAMAKRSRAMWSGDGARYSLLVLTEMLIIGRWLRRYQPMRLPEIMDPRPVQRIAAE